MLSIKKWVDEDAENGSPWNNFFDYHSATNTDGDGFHLGIMTEEQRDLLKQYAYRGVCVDSTHNCTRYKYKLVTLLVFDDIGRGALAPSTSARKRAPSSYFHSSKPFENDVDH
uniref:Uncharacterized protein n=1 Tax=Plectus sambesii TaxID=2011161 RepID=A0A914WGN5_9BILA